MELIAGKLISTVGHANTRDDIARPDNNVMVCPVRPERILFARVRTNYRRSLSIDVLAIVTARAPLADQRCSASASRLRRSRWGGHRRRGTISATGDRHTNRTWHRRIGIIGYRLCDRGEQRSATSEIARVKTRVTHPEDGRGMKEHNAEPNVIRTVL